MAGRAKENLLGGSPKYQFLYLRFRIFKCYIQFMYIYGRIVYRQIIVIGTHTQTPTYTVCWLISNAKPSHRNCHFGLPASQIWRLCIDVWSEVSGPQIRQSWAFKYLFELCFYFLHVWISLHRGLLPQMHVVIVYIYIQYIYILYMTLFIQ